MKPDQMQVRAKKHLGQHFLKDDSVCQKISNALTKHMDYQHLVEIGPGTGALTKHLIPLDYSFSVMEVDTESIQYLNQHYPDLQVHHQDFLKLDVSAFYGEEQFGVIGNFPYNISSQIIFKILEHKEQVPEVVGMFQKEVAERICEPPGNKTYGILSVLVQAYYQADYLFTIDEHVFDPPPKVKSGILHLKRKESIDIGVDYKTLKMVVKLAFNQRRKTLRNSLKTLGINDKLSPEILANRPEQLSYREFIEIAKALS